MSNTFMRLSSGLFLVFLVLGCFWIGAESFFVFAFLVSLGLYYELGFNFFKIGMQNYLLGIPLILLSYIICYLYPQSAPIFLGGALLILLFLLVFLFGKKKKLLEGVEVGLPFILLIWSVFPLLAITSFFWIPQWSFYLGSLLMATISMDVGGWFFGKNFGRNKLWPAVSPNKTIEGLIGGALLAGFMGALLSTFFGVSLWKWFAMTFFIGLLSQLGDLVQSRIKRSFAIKDSGNLIPGHGGVYDRVDGLIFSGPIYALILRVFS